MNKDILSSLLSNMRSKNEKIYLELKDDKYFNDSFNIIFKYICKEVNETIENGLMKLDELCQMSVLNTETELKGFINEQIDDIFNKGEIKSSIIEEIIFKEKTRIKKQFEYHMHKDIVDKFEVKIQEKLEEYYTLFKFLKNSRIIWKEKTKNLICYNNQYINEFNIKMMKNLKLSDSIKDWALPILNDDVEKMNQSLIISVNGICKYEKQSEMRTGFDLKGGDHEVISKFLNSQIAGIFTLIARWDRIT